MSHVDCDRRALRLVCGNARVPIKPQVYVKEANAYALAITLGRLPYARRKDGRYEPVSY